MTTDPALVGRALLPSLGNDRAVRAIVVVVLLFAPLAVGTVEVWSWTVVAVLALLALWLLARQRQEPLSWTLAGAAWLAITLYTVVQLTPLPAPLVRALSPVAHEIWTLAVPDARFIPLSLSPAATAGELVKLTALCALFAVAVNFFGPYEERRRFLLTAVTLAGALVTAFGFVVTLGAGRRVLGVYTVGAPFFVSSFVNANHLAAFLGITSLTAVGLAASTRVRDKRLAFVALAVFTAVGLCLTLSRGGMVAFAAGLLFLSALLLKARDTRGALWVPLAAALVLSLTAAVAFQKLAAELAVDVEGWSRESKLAVWTGELNLARDFVLTGAGRGVNPELSARYNTLSREVTITHAENEYLQVVLDWGVLGGLVVWVMLVAGFWALKRGGGAGPLAGAAAGLFFAALHNVADFNLETGGVAVVFVLLLGLVMGAAQRAGPRFVTPARFTGRLALVAIIPVVGCAFMARRYSLDADTKRLAAIEAHGADELVQAAQPLVRRHPADHFLPLSLANQLLVPERRDPAQALLWAGRAAYLNPASLEAHLIMARILVEGGASTQAQGEYRLAAALDSRANVVEEIVKRFPTLAAVRRAVPSDPDNQVKLGWALIGQGRLMQAEEVAYALLAEPASDTRALHLLGEIARRERHVAQAQALAQEALAQDPSLAWPYGLLAQLPQKPAERVAALKEGLLVWPDDPALLRTAAFYSLEAGAYEEAEVYSKRLKQIGRPAEAHFLFGRIEETRQRYPLALEQYRAAATVSPASVEYRLAVARVLERIGIDSEAMAEYDRLWRQGYRTPHVAERLRVLEEKSHEAR